MKFLKRVVTAMNHRNRSEALNYLQAMPDDQLTNSGFSPHLVRQGISGWPWRMDHQCEQVSKIESNVVEHRCTKELERCSALEFADLGYIPKNYPIFGSTRTSWYR